MINRVKIIVSDATEGTLGGWVIPMLAQTDNKPYLFIDLVLLKITRIFTKDACVTVAKR